MNSESHQDIISKLKEERDALAEALLKSKDGAESTQPPDHTKTVKHILNDYKYGFKCFEVDLKEFLKLDDSKLQDRTIWFQDGKYREFIHTLLDAQKKFLEKDVSPERKLYNFFLAFIQGNTKPTVDISSCVRFKSKKLLTEKILSSLDKKEKPIFEAEPTECPRVIIELQTNLYENDEERVTSNQLVEHMLPYIFSKSENQQYPRLFGFLLSLDGVEIVWIENFIAGKEPERKQISLYDFDWHFDNLKFFLENFQEDLKLDGFEEAEFVSLSQFYVFWQFIFHVICDKF